MTLFPESVFATLVYASLAMTALGGTTLIVLLARDWKGRNLW